MKVYDAIIKRRTIRKFSQREVSEDDLLRLVDCARVAAYGANLQPLKFAVLRGRLCESIFPFIKWAAYSPEIGPNEKERPTAYIAVLGDRQIKANGMFEADAGAAVTSMMLEAEELGLGSCWLGAIARDDIKKTLRLDDNLDVVYLLALGYPMQKSRMVDMCGDVKYFASDDGTINVPKRSLDEILIKTD